ncbi:MAG: hypothetical protein ACYTHK_12315 [Planctomycetota bacterium]|jgi:hypothetical protein
MRFLLELITDLLGEIGFRVFCIVWFLGCTFGLGLLGIPLGYHPKYGVMVGAVIGAAVPAWWWVKRQIAEQRELAD